MFQLASWQRLPSTRPARVSNGLSFNRSSSKGTHSKRESKCTHSNYRASSKQVAETVPNLLLGRVCPAFEPPISLPDIVGGGRVCLMTWSFNRSSLKGTHSKKELKCTHSNYRASSMRLGRVCPAFDPPISLPKHCRRRTRASIDLSSR